MLSIYTKVKSKSLNVLSILQWNYVDAFLRPNGITFHWYCPSTTKNIIEKKEKDKKLHVTSIKEFQEQAKEVGKIS